MSVIVTSRLQYERDVSIIETSWPCRDKHAAILGGAEKNVNLYHRFTGERDMTIRSRHDMYYGHLALLAIVSFYLLSGCGPRNGFIPLVGDYSLIVGSANVVVIVYRGDDPLIDKLEIPEKVIGVGYDETFILAKQQELGGLPGSGFGPPEPIPGRFNYWILNVKSNKIWGPLAIEEFTALRKELGVSESIKLHDASDYYGSNPKRTPQKYD